MKKLLSKILDFTTGLGFYGVGLLAASLSLFVIGWTTVAAGFLGAFVFKNYSSIVKHVRSLLDRS